MVYSMSINPQMKRIGGVLTPVTELRPCFQELQSIWKHPQRSRTTTLTHTRPTIPPRPNLFISAATMLALWRLNLTTSTRTRRSDHDLWEVISIFMTRMVLVYRFCANRTF